MSQEAVTTTTSGTNEWDSGNGSGEVVEKWGSIVINRVIYLSFVALVGTIANLIVIFRGLRYKNGLTSSCNHRSAAMDTTSMLVISLAVSNLGTSTFSVGIDIFPLFFPYVLVNDFACRFIWPVRELFTAVACYALTFIAVGRYLILFRSFKNTRIFSSPVANNIALWIFSYLLIALPFAAAYKPVYANGTWLCDTYWATPEAQRAHVIFLILFNSFVPASLVCVSYIGIIRHLEKVRNIFRPTSTMETRTDNDEALSISVTSHRVAKISVFLLLSFIITYVPFGVLLLCIEYYDLDAHTFPELETLFTVAFCLLHTGAVIDPMIILFSSNVYRPDCGLLKKILRR